MDLENFTMLIEDPTLARDLKQGIVNPAELERYLLTHYPAPALAHELAQCLIEAQALSPLVLTMSQVQSHIRIQGFRWKDGELVKENRGNYSKKEK